jgi:hypothetical protein
LLLAPPPSVVHMDDHSSEGDGRGGDYADRVGEATLSTRGYEYTLEFLSARVGSLRMPTRALLLVVAGAAFINAQHIGTRVLMLPGQVFRVCFVFHLLGWLHWEGSDLMFPSPSHHIRTGRRLLFAKKQPFP